MLPGTMLHRFAKRCLRDDVRERVIDAQIADFQHEWLDARTSRRRFATLVRGYFALAASFSVALFKDIQQDRMQTGRAQILSALLYILGGCIGASIFSFYETGTFSFVAVWHPENRGPLAFVPLFVWFNRISSGQLTRLYRSYLVAITLSTLIGTAIHGPGRAWQMDVSVYVLFAFVVPGILWMLNRTFGWKLELPTQRQG